MKKIYEVDNIVNLFKLKHQGNIITYKELQEYTHYNFSDYIDFDRFKKNTMAKAKNKLIEEGIIIKAIPNEGYYILKSNQIQSYTYRTYIRRPLKQFQKAEKILNNTIVNSLNAEELQKHKLTVDLNKQLINTNNEIINLKKFKDLDM